MDQFIYNVNQDFTEAMDDDLNISGALASVFEFIRKVNVPLTERRLNKKEWGKIIKTMKKIDSVLGIMDFEEEKISEEALGLLEKREETRAAGNWNESDRIREKLSGMGIIVLDTPNGTIWKIK